FEPRSSDGRAGSCHGIVSWQRAFVCSTITSLACFLLCLLFAIPSGHAQGVGTSGEIAGTITDSSGGVLPKATVNVVDSQTGLKRTTTTNNTGQFRVAGL